MEIATRRVHFAGCTPNPTEPWMKQIARNLTDAEDGFLNGKRYLIMDRDGEFCPAFREILKSEGVEPVLLPPKSPNLNAHLERFHRSLKELHFRRSDGEVKQDLEEPVKFAIVWGARQSGEKLFLQHFAGNRATAVGVRGTTLGLVPATRSAVGQFGLVHVPAA